MKIANKAQIRGLYKATAIFLLSILSVVWSVPFPVTPAFAQSILGLPAPGTMVAPSVGYMPTILKGIKVYPENPLKFDFIVETGDAHLEGAALQEETTKLIRYFLAALTVPEDNLWVNLSPYENDRIIPEQFSFTEMGRDLLAQDYLLKQLTASLIYPEEDIGKEFWHKVYSKAQAIFGTTQVPVNTFNKVWIVPEEAEIYENGDKVFILGSHLKVMLEEDYLSLNKNLSNEELGTDRVSDDAVKELSNVSSSVVREIVIPEIEREINEGKNFALLRQIYHSVILATWYKRNLKESLLNKVYTNQSKVAGIDIKDKDVKQKIYEQYLAAFQKGVYNYITEEYDQFSQELIPRKYFSGGTHMGKVQFKRANNPAAIAALEPSGLVVAQSGLRTSGDTSGLGGGQTALLGKKTEGTTGPRNLPFDQFTYDYLKERKFSYTPTFVDLGTGLYPITTNETAQFFDGDMNIIGVDNNMPNYVVLFPSDNGQQNIGYFEADSSAETGKGKHRLSHVARVRQIGDNQFSFQEISEEEREAIEVAAISHRDDLMRKGYGEDFESISDFSDQRDISDGEVQIQFEPTRRHADESLNVRFKKGGFELSSVEGEADIIRVASVFWHYNSEETKEALRAMAKKLKQDGIIMAGSNKGFFVFKKVEDGSEDEVYPAEFIAPVMLNYTRYGDRLFNIFNDKFVYELWSFEEGSNQGFSQYETFFWALREEVTRVLKASDDLRKLSENPRADYLNAFILDTLVKRIVEGLQANGFSVTVDDNNFLHIQYDESLNKVRDSSALSGKEELKRSFSDGTFLRQGMERLREANPGVEMNQAADVSRLNPHVTGFDLALLPLLERVPAAVTSDKDWGIYRVRPDGITYRTGDGAEDEFIPFTQEAQLVMEELIGKSSVSATGRILNDLDNSNLHRPDAQLTEYDRLRLAIEETFGDSIPLAFDDATLTSGAAERSQITPDQVVTGSRFTLKELQVIYDILAALPRHLLEGVEDRYFTYRPTQENPRNFPVIRNGSASYVLAPLERVRTGTDFLGIYLSPEIRGYLEQFSDEDLRMYSFLRIILHEKGHRIYPNLTEEQTRAYSAISWEPGSFERSSKQGKKRREGASADSAEHFLMLYPHVDLWDNSEEEFNDHLSAYRLFGPQFREAAKRSPFIAAKYEFLRNEVFNGIEFEDTYVYTPAATRGDTSGLGGGDKSVDRLRDEVERNLQGITKIRRMQGKDSYDGWLGVLNQEFRISDFLRERTQSQGRVRLADVSMGVGVALMEAVNEYGDKVEATGVDIVNWNQDNLTDEELEQLRGQFPADVVDKLLKKEYFNFIEDDMGKVEFTEPQDLIIDFYALQYHEDPLGTIAHLFGQLAPNGVLVVQFGISHRSREQIGQFKQFAAALDPDLDVEFEEMTSYPERWVGSLIVRRGATETIRINAPIKERREVSVTHKGEREIKINEVVYDKAVTPIAFVQRPDTSALGGEAALLKPVADEVVGKWSAAGWQGNSRLSEWLANRMATAQANGLDPQEIRRVLDEKITPHLGSVEQRAVLSGSNLSSMILQTIEVAQDDEDFEERLSTIVDAVWLPATRLGYGRNFVSLVDLDARMHPILKDRVQWQRWVQRVNQTVESLRQMRPGLFAVSAEDQKAAGQDVAFSLDAGRVLDKLRTPLFFGILQEAQTADDIEPYLSALETFVVQLTDPSPYVHLAIQHPKEPSADFERRRQNFSRANAAGQAAWALEELAQISFLIPDFHDHWEDNLNALAASITSLITSLGAIQDPAYGQDYGFSRNYGYEGMTSAQFRRNLSTYTAFINDLYSRLEGETVRLERAGKEPLTLSILPNRNSLSAFLRTLSDVAKTPEQYVQQLEDTKRVLAELAPAEVGTVVNRYMISHFESLMQDLRVPSAERGAFMSRLLQFTLERMTRGVHQQTIESSWIPAARQGAGNDRTRFWTQLDEIEQFRARLVQRIGTSDRYFLGLISRLLADLSRTAGLDLGGTLRAVEQLVDELYDSEHRDNLILLITNFSEFAADLLDDQSLTAAVRMVRAGWQPNPALLQEAREAEDLDELFAQWRTIADDIQQGGFTLDTMDADRRQRYIGVEYTQFVNAMRQAGFGIERHRYRMFTSVIEEGPKRALEQLAGRLSVELDYAIYEAIQTLQMIEDVAAQAPARREVVAVANHSYGGFVMDIIEEDLEAQDVRMVHIKIGSTESHNNPWVVRADLFTDAELAHIVRTQPHLVVVDGTGNFGQATEDEIFGRNPDSYQGYRSFLIAFNIALAEARGEDVTRREGEILLGKDAEFRNGFGADFDTLVERIRQQMSRLSAAELAQLSYYDLKFWNPAGLTSLLSEFRQQLTTAPSVTPSEITSPSLIVANAVMLDQHLPQAVRARGEGFPHGPATFDDNDVIRNFELNVTDRGVRHVKLLKPVIRQRYPGLKEEFYRKVAPVTETARASGQADTSALSGMEGIVQPQSFRLSRQRLMNHLLNLSGQKIMTQNPARQDKTMRLIVAVLNDDINALIANIETPMSNQEFRSTLFRMGNEISLENARDLIQLASPYFDPGSDLEAQYESIRQELLALTGLPLDLNRVLKTESDLHHFFMMVSGDYAEFARHMRELLNLTNRPQTTTAGRVIRALIYLTQFKEGEVHSAEDFEELLAAALVLHQAIARLTGDQYTYERKDLVQRWGELLGLVRGIINTNPQLKQVFIKRAQNDVDVRLADINLMRFVASPGEVVGSLSTGQDVSLSLKEGETREVVFYDHWSREPIRLRFERYDNGKLFFARQDAGATLRQLDLGDSVGYGTSNPVFPVHLIMEAGQDDFLVGNARDNERSQLLVKLVRDEEAEMKANVVQKKEFLATQDEVTIADLDAGDVKINLGGVFPVTITRDAAGRRVIRDIPGNSVLLEEGEPMVLGSETLNLFFGTVPQDMPPLITGREIEVTLSGNSATLRSLGTVIATAVYYPEVQPGDTSALASGEELKLSPAKAQILLNTAPARDSMLRLLAIGHPLFDGATETILDPQIDPDETALLLVILEGVDLAAVDEKLEESRFKDLYEPLFAQIVGYARQEQRKEKETRKREGLKYGQKPKSFLIKRREVKGLILADEDRGTSVDMFFVKDYLGGLTFGMAGAERPYFIETTGSQEIGNPTEDPDSPVHIRVTSRPRSFTIENLRDGSTLRIRDLATFGDTSALAASDLEYKPGAAQFFGKKIGMLKVKGEKLPVIGFGGNSEVFDNGRSVVRIWYRDTNPDQEQIDEFLAQLKLFEDSGKGPAYISHGVTENGYLYFQIEKIDGDTLGDSLKKADSEKEALLVNRFADRLEFLIRNKIHDKDAWNVNNYRWGRKVAQSEEAEPTEEEEHLYTVDFEHADSVISITQTELAKKYKEEIESEAFEFWTEGQRAKFHERLDQFIAQGGDTSALGGTRGVTAESSELGGIDLNPGGINLRTRGEGVEFDIPFDPGMFENTPVDGFVPVIFQITPVTNLPLLLGVNETEEEQYLSRLD